MPTIPRIGCFLLLAFRLVRGVFSVTSLGPSILDLCPVTSRISSGLYRRYFQISSHLHAPRLSRVFTIPDFPLGSKHPDVGSKSVFSRGLRTYLAFLDWVLLPCLPFPASSDLPRVGFAIASVRHTRGAVSYVAIVGFLIPAFYSELCVLGCL